jgi:outer membrane lipoprotein-sorting protein
VKTSIATVALNVACSLTISCCVLTISSCKRAAESSEHVNARELPVSATPPFATKEPSRYRAIRTITSLVAGADKPQISTTIIARDGQRRREEYDSLNEQKIAYLTTPAGSFILLPSARVLAALDGSTSSEILLPGADTELSADRLLNEISIETRYQKLGSEILNGRSATKYRVLTGSLTPGGAPTSETMIWIDEALEMPVKWETKTSSEGGQTETRMELTQISLDSDPRAFELPKDYRKIEMAELLSLIQGQKQQETPKTVKK